MNQIQNQTDPSLVGLLHISQAEQLLVVVVAPLRVVGPGGASHDGGPRGGRGRIGVCSISEDDVVHGGPVVDVARLDRRVGSVRRVVGGMVGVPESAPIDERG